MGPSFLDNVLLGKELTVGALKVEYVHNSLRYPMRLLFFKSEGNYIAMEITHSDVHYVGKSIERLLDVIQDSILNDTAPVPSIIDPYYGPIFDAYRVEDKYETIEI